MKVDIIGDAFVLTSSIPVDDILFLATNAPDKLVVRSKTGKEDKEPGDEIFKISYNSDLPSIYKFETTSGITFGGKTRDDKGLATYTGKIPVDAANAKEYVADIIAPVFEYLQQLETEIPAAINKHKENRKKLLNFISENGATKNNAGAPAASTTTGKSNEKRTSSPAGSKSDNNDNPDSDDNSDNTGAGDDSSGG